MTVLNEQNNQFLFVNLVPEDDALRVTCQYKILYNEKPNGNSCFLPGLNIYFFAIDNDTMIKKGRVLTKYYFDYFLKHTAKNGLKKLALDLNKKGFKLQSDHNSTMHKLVNKKPVKANFLRSLNDEVPENFSTASSVNQREEFALA